MESNKNKLAQRTKRNTQNLAYWTFGWLLSMAAARFGPSMVWGQNTIGTVIAIFFNLGIGVGMILAIIRYVKGLDELQQKIQLEAMSIALGISVIAGLGYSLFERSGILDFHAEISHMVILISITYFTATVIGRIKYK